MPYPFTRPLILSFFGERGRGRDVPLTLRTSLIRSRMNKSPLGWIIASSPVRIQLPIHSIYVCLSCNRRYSLPIHPCLSRPTPHQPVKIDSIRGRRGGRTHAVSLPSYPRQICGPPIHNSPLIFSPSSPLSSFLMILALTPGKNRPAEPRVPIFCEGCCCRAVSAQGPGLARRAYHAAKSSLCHP